MISGGEVLAELARYGREHPEDAVALARFRQLLENTPAPLSRMQYRPGHLTCSACVLGGRLESRPTRSEPQASEGGPLHGVAGDGARVLLLHHTRLGRWLQPGGHVEPGDAAPLASALREVREESGLSDLRPLARANSSALVDLDIHEIPARGPEPAHLHYDLRYAFAAGGEQSLVRSEESTAVRWIEVARLRELTDEESVARLVARTLARALALTAASGPAARQAAVASKTP